MLSFPRAEWWFVPPGLSRSFIHSKLWMCNILTEKALPFPMQSDSLQINISSIIHSRVKNVRNTHRQWERANVLCRRKLLYEYFRYLIIIEKWLREVFYRRVVEINIWYDLGWLREKDREKNWYDMERVTRKSIEVCFCLSIKLLTKKLKLQSR